jgi:Protein of unknown function (DUF2934)
MAAKADSGHEAGEDVARVVGDDADRNGEAVSDEEAIRRRAYELSLEDGASTPDENWRRAEAELSSGRSAGSQV